MPVSHSAYIAYNQNSALINNASSTDNLVVVAKEKKVTLDTGESKLVVIFSKVPADKLKGNKFDCKLGSGKNAVQYILNRIKNNQRLTEQEKENLILPITTQLIASPKNKCSIELEDWSGDLLPVNTFEQIYNHINSENKVSISDFTLKKLTGNIDDTGSAAQEKQPDLSPENKKATPRTTTAPPNRPPPLPPTGLIKTPPTIKPQLPPKAGLPDWLTSRKQ